MAKRDTPTVTPKLRFPVFRGSSGWSVKAMDRLYSFMRNNSLSRDKLNYENGLAKNIHYGDIHTKFPALFDITKERVPYVNGTEEVPGAESEDYCVEGDLIFADASEDTNDVGKSMEIVRLAGERLLSGQHTILARRRDDTLVVGFGGYLFRSQFIRPQVEREAQGTKIYQISSSRLGGIHVAYPEDKGEQQKIADCLASLDDVIAAQERKVQALQTHKRGLMQQLFPREGEARPRLRFPEFRDAPDWSFQLLRELEGKKLIELGRGNVISHIDMRADPGSYPVYSSSVINQGLMGTYGKFMFDEELISWSVDGGGHFFHRPKHKFSVTNVSGFMRVLDSSAVVCSFLAYQLQKLHASQKFDYQQKAHPSVIRALYRVGLPDPKEQRRIADCLSFIDTQIAAESSQLAALKTDKQGLMQQLFPACEGT